MIVESKYKGYGELELRETGHDYDFIATVENPTGKVMKIFVDDLEGWYSEPLKVEPYNWIGFLADDEGKFMVESIKNGDFKVEFE